jgi:prepilin-type N-terminal cleavage/methylation domain-containing protein
MKKFISKVKKSYHKFMTGKSAFSLVELIVVIAIMAVMAAVLAPALLGYVEKSRMQKDSSAMDEIVNTVQLALADQNVYDEVLEHSVYDNVSCYIDTASEGDHADHKVTLKDAHGEYKEQYMFDDEARLLDETVYYAAGNMRGMTITFSPSDSGDTYDLKNGVINKFVGRKTGYLYENPELYNRVRSTIGDTLETTSQTYRNSDYTLFIRVGSTGGAEAQAQDAISVWGQYSHY